MSAGVVVTGGGDGVGRAVARRFAAGGARVHICDVREDALREVLAADPGLRGTVADVGSPADVARLFREATAWLGAVDVLINNVGIAGPRALLEDMSDEDWDVTMRVNVGGMFSCTKHVLPGMKERGRGVIVNVSSGSARTRPPQRSVYNVSKAAVDELTRSVAREAGPWGVRVNAIQPGAVNNDRMRRVLQRIAEAEGRTADEVLEDFLKYVSMRTVVEPEDIAEMCWFLASDAARYVTGQVIGVDGGVEWEQ